MPESYCATPSRSTHMCLRLDGARDFRTLLAAALYLKRWLRYPAHPAARFTAREIDWVVALGDWRPVPRPALAAVGGL